jgi:hypothetical protein
MPDANDSLDELSERLLTLRQTVLADTEALLLAWHVAPEAYDSGVRNMARYVALRRHDLRSLQRELTPWGLSSLGRLEGHVLETLDAVVRALSALTGEQAQETIAAHPPASFFAGDRLLRNRALVLFGPPSPGTDVSIMVTLDPVNSGTSEALEQLITRGATCFRINFVSCSRWHSGGKHFSRRSARSDTIPGPVCCSNSASASGAKSKMLRTCVTRARDRPSLRARSALDSPWESITARHSRAR